MDSSSTSDNQINSNKSSTLEEENNYNLNIKQCLEIQLNELEMLQSMFSNPGEFQLFDSNILNSISNYINNSDEILPNHIDFTICLNISNIKLEICFNLCHMYPCEEPEVFIRSNQLDRINQTKFNLELTNYIQLIEKEEICLYSIINWIQDNVTNYYNQDTISKSEKDSTVQSQSSKNKYSSFSRYWIYSHHIYSKIKRKTMLDLSGDLNITGFCLPGKPGIICIEGTSIDCEDWWHRIRSMTWKRIMCKKIEEINVINIDDFDTNRKFDNFKEISFVSKGSVKQDFHMDMGEFNKYLIEKNCGYMFKEYFGF